MSFVLCPTLREALLYERLRQRVQQSLMGETPRRSLRDATRTRTRLPPALSPLGEDSAASPLTRLCHLSWVLLMVTNDKRQMTNDQ
ncbi:hypothetical protein [Nostoc sp. 'Peltigera membranacea cyanobiont' 210A]|uniref:hypothetical protein n=1 Tax=Nostoc sp. 'Peltigera membranacea cyanobiont' 210A TaxID=2014529 RepID=UPI001180523E|nr:hypothetical protein [Nostoc sp. 'Peltigera membranacea cyanobiont' 210A]